MKTDTTEVSVFKAACIKASALAALMVRLPVAALTGCEPDAWRRVVGLGLKSDGTKFGLSAFGLDLFSDVPAQASSALTREAAEAHFVQRWAQFIRGEPEARWVLRHRKHHVERFPGNGEIVVAKFAEDGKLQKLETFLDAAKRLRPREMRSGFKLRGLSARRTD